MHPSETKQLSNYDIDKVVTPIDVDQLQKLLLETNYDRSKTQFLVEGFRDGFRLGYNGPRDIQLTANNLRFRVGDKFDLWNKIMTEVEAKRYAGPYESIQSIQFPGNDTGWIQSPCGLVAKSNNRTRLINHHSYPPGSSLNDGIDDAHAKVTYQDFQDAIRLSIKLQKANPGGQLYYTKSDGKNAFRVLPIHPHDRRWQVLKAENPLTGRFVYFVDLCVSFGNWASCFLYESFSKAMAHIYQSKAGVPGISYLDDALQAGIGEQQANQFLGIFLQLCQQIGMPVADDKTVTATPIIVFLGMIINALHNTVGLPVDKVDKALNQLDRILHSKSVTILDMQKVTGLLNFFCRAVVPGRAFTRRLYAAYSGLGLKQHHHVKVSPEMRLDLAMWQTFLTMKGKVFRPFVDFDDDNIAIDLAMTSDAAKSDQLGYAAFCRMPNSFDAYYCFDRWDLDLISDYDPSIQFLELFALSVGITLFSEHLRDMRVRIYCDNQAVLNMVNNGSSACKHCMLLIRHITLCALKNNVVYDVRYINTKDNAFADLLSRMKHVEFLNIIPAEWKLTRVATPVELLPVEKFFKVFRS